MGSVIPLTSDEESFLLYKTESKEGSISYRRKIDNIAADIVAAKLSNKLAYDINSESWAVWSGSHWSRTHNEMVAKRHIYKAVESGTHPIGFNNRYLNAIVEQIKVGDRLNLPAFATNVVPFSNGLLSIVDNTLQKAVPENALDYVLPHDYSTTADCPAIMAWLSESVEHDEDTVRLLLAWLAALVRGLALQKFLVLIGPGGTSKGVFQRLGAALVGSQNTEVSTLQNLESNRFEMAKHHGKRLCLINEAGRFGGHLANLKAMTGGDQLPLERKNKQQTGTFVYTGQVWLATNEDIASHDSGLERRRITVRFSRKVSTEQKKQWLAAGGEEAVLHSEIPGLIRHLLAIPVPEIHERVEHLPERVKVENMVGMRAGSSVADWVLEACEFELCENTRTQIGLYKPDEYQPGLLYPRYRRWCEGTGRKAVAQNKFKGLLFEVADSLGYQLKEIKDQRTRQTFIQGISLKN